MLGCYFHKHKCKATYIEIGVYLDVMVNCKFAIILCPTEFDTFRNSDLKTGSHTGNKHSKNKD